MKVLAAIILFVLSYSNSNAEELYPVLIDDDMAYIDKSGEVIIKTDYSPDIDEELREIGSQVIEYIEFPQFSYFSEGYALVKDVISFFGIIDLSKTYYLINSQGNTVFESDEVIDQFKCGYARKYIGILGVGNTIIGFENNFLDKDLNNFLPDNFEYVSYFSECYALVKRDKFGYIDQTGKLVIDCQFEDAGDFSEDFANVQLNGLYGYIDKQGKMIIEPKYEAAFEFNSGIARVYNGYKFLFIDKSGNEISDKRYVEALDFSERFACVKDNYLYKFINTNGDEVFDIQTPFPSYFSSGLAAVFINGKWTYINQKGEIQFPAIYDYAKAFDRDLAMVWYKDDMYYLNKAGQLVWNISEQRKAN